ncbi:glycosyltransferase family 2 protein [Leuconostoc lactis]|uniref:glycosyltransferase family 2 protein n=1 Tax=Leuconostoc lactis TaxID=1246 RepID=UPI0028ABB96F|nr:glycosyltransferase family 2 protein [Leuconostoc lactis]
MLPKVSVIITSIGRDDLKFAVNSVKDQTYDNIEIILVLDGVLPEGVDTNDLKVIYLDGVRNGNIARNTGIKASSGEFIALLDDDDIFYPDKIQKQIEHIRNANDVTKVVSYTKVKSFSRKTNDSKIVPSSSINENENVLDYLFRATDPGFIQTSTLLAHRSLFLNNLFDETITKHQDWDWLINIQKKFDIEFLFLNEILVEYQNNQPGTSVGTQNKWRYSIDWVTRYEDVTSEETRSRFKSMVIFNIMTDYSMSKMKRCQESIKLVGEIPIRQTNLRLISLLKIVYYFLKY